MGFDNLLVERDNAVAIITLNRPSALNALNTPLLTELDVVATELAGDAAVRAAVITGAGDRAFAAGADIGELSLLSGNDATSHAAFGQRVFRRIEQMGKPVIAAVNGFALGGGCELAMACTFRLAATSARFGQPEISLGLIPGFGGTERLPRLVGVARALDLLLSGRTITADEALAIGLVGKVVPGAELMAEARSLAGSLATKPPQAVQAMMTAVRNTLAMPADAAQQAEASLFGIVASTDDAKEGTRAFLDKRTPRFS